MEDHYEHGHIPKRTDCPVRQESSGPVVRQISRPDRHDKFGTVHVDLTGPMQAPGVRGHLYLLVVAHW
eukprot:7345624-Prorocentrum_lima.AAC.1